MRPNPMRRNPMRRNPPPQAPARAHLDDPVTGAARGPGGPPKRGGARPGRHGAGPAGPRPAAAARPTQVQGGDPARRVAYELLRAVGSRDAYANLTMPQLLRSAGLSGRDAAFATELGYGTLRSLGTYDAVLAACVDRPLDRVDPPVLDVLRLGAHQLLGMRVPTHAAVSATVDLGRAAAGPGPATFVNAVLRRVSQHDLRAWHDQLAPPYDTDPAGHLGFFHAHPRWVAQSFADALGGDWAAVAEACRADNVPARVTLAARPGRCTVADLVALGAEPTPYSPYGAVLPGGDPADLAAVRRGDAGVQDEGSQLVALALAAAPLEGPDDCWLDACAGPGGKAALLAGLAAARGARLVAAEIAPHRAGLVARALDGDPGRPAVVVADSTAPPWHDGAFDRVLVDAPCTGLGALRRRPEARWRRQPSDVGRLFDLQARLLDRALDAARPGGVVMYATCSPHVGETRGVLAHVLEHRPGDELEDVRPLLGGVPHLGPGPHVQLWPHLHNTDAMFLALIRRGG
jgi:16S rRNA (cytosine967-C5)-methyltransferase